jgi:hypothetical protein
MIAAAALALVRPGAAAAQSAAPSAPASAAPSASPSTGPIRIDSCDVKKLYSQMGLGNLFVNGKGYNFFNVTFTNTAQVPVKRIVFQIEFDKSRYVVGDDGTFQPGVQVTHHLRDQGKDVKAFARTGTGPTACSVLSATYADGTTWEPPAASSP